MAYTPLPIPEHIGPLVRAVVQGALDPRLADVNALLHLPLPGIEAGGNFTIADSLFGCIEGVSAVLYPRFGKSNKVFLECMCRHYGAEANEPFGGLPTADVATDLLFKFRHPMQHCLGLALSPPHKTQLIREPMFMDHELRVARVPVSSPEHIALLEQDGWPAFLRNPTLAFHADGAKVLCVEALYVGTRRLIRSVLADERAMEFAEDGLRDYLKVNAHARRSSDSVPATVDYWGARLFDGPDMGEFEEYFRNKTED